jgi:hypothetical protein
LLDLEPDDIEVPLAQFQMAKAEKEDTKKIVNVINKCAGDEEQPQRLLDKYFRLYWNNFERTLESIPKPKEAIEGEWLWADGQKIAINKDGTCKSIRDYAEFNSGTWKQSGFDECVFILDWELLKATDILTLSSDFLNLGGCNTEGGYITAARIPKER